MEKIKLIMAVENVFSLVYKNITDIILANFNLMYTQKRNVCIKNCEFLE